PYGQVLSNFINNALLHAFEERSGGVMRLEAHILHDAATEQVKICFRDNGLGISDEYLGRIFDPFFTTKMGRGGNGLGLYTSYNIVTSLLSGQIEVDSQLGQGTCFTLVLPLVAPHSGAYLH
ncbi:MAG: hypothetical protein RL748_1624, partial [Pseudomonadota bacterium]